MGQEHTPDIQQLIRIDTLCRQFEADWKRDQRVPFQPYLDQALPGDRDCLAVELVAVEIELRFRVGEVPQLEPYKQAFPELADQIIKAFEEVVSDFTKNWRTVGIAPLPESLGDFRIVREIGRGAMGVVYEAEQKSLKRTVALKVLPAAFGLSVSRLKRFQRESLAVARMHHSHIVDIYGTGEQDGIHYFAMRYVDGQSLGHLLDESDGSARIPPHVLAQRAYVVAKIGFQIGQALQYAHERGVLHRDIKPANILLDRRENAWLTDFGLAKITKTNEDNLAGERDLVGSLRYLSPESLQGHVDERSDIYSLGLTLYEIVCHRPAFTAKDISEGLQSLALREAERLDQRLVGIPRDFAAVIHKALARNPSNRYQTAGEMADDLNRFLHHEPVLARHYTASEQVWHWAGRNRSCAKLLLVLALVQIVITAAATWAVIQF
jgi:eukaryotic-like serine/threonine-protein kinase